MGPTGGYVQGKWVNQNAEDYRPQICFEVIADDYFQIKYRNFRDNQARDMIKRLRSHGEQAIMWDISQNCWNV